MSEQLTRREVCGINFAVLAAKAGLSYCEAKDERERVLGTWPVLADDCFPAAAQQAAEDERDDDDVVELTGDGDEVGDEVEGQRQVSGQRDQESLLPARHAWVAEQPAAENDTVGDKAGECPRALSSAGDDEGEHEGGVREEEESADCDERPGGEAHWPEASLAHA